MNFLALILYRMFEANKKHLLRGKWRLETRGGAVLGGISPRAGR
jgi:hypothetical protein